MGIVIHQYISPFSFVMGILWFNTFILLGLLMRKLKFPIKFSVIPLLLLLILSILRMFVAVNIPGAVVVLSDTVYPAIVSFFDYEIIPHRIFGFPIRIYGVAIFVWIAVAVILTTRYIYGYIRRFGFIINWLGKSKRDEYAELLLSDIIGHDKYFRVYRNGSLNTAIATAFRPYIILPEIDFSPNELRVILLHEWKHIQDRDYLTGIVINIICFVYWWNPVVYILKRNFRFAMELKCDQFAVSNKNDFASLLRGILLLNGLEMKKREQSNLYESANTFISGDDGLNDRIKVLYMQDDSRGKKIITNILYSVFFLVLFTASYTFIILPAFWMADYIPTIKDYMDEYTKGGGVYQAEENYIIDNGDGTFSLYIDGQFVIDIDNTSELISVLPIYVGERD